ncbi:phage head completion protein [Aeromonas veronii]|uniref:phage head completion protein n=1 Tax=Aeromonas veronii TaxID=654 RepID=UPI003D1DA39B
MRIGLMRENIEVWESKTSLNEYGTEVKQTELMLACPAAVKFVSKSEVGGSTKTRNTTVEFTCRMNRYFRAPDPSMYIKWDGQEYDITDDDNYFSLNKYIKLTAVKRSK